MFLKNSLNKHNEHSLRKKGFEEEKGLSKNNKEETKAIIHAALLDLTELTNKRITETKSKDK
ncbi:hypothetical protein B6U93_02145 [Candidatus Woesearchaeota archaeon ex4484_78]|nr:MAG: hypothetical protein B6U93_02145 [Candidatus Woesearchaeota archaeon ex4484_78]